ncbi:serine hydrolase [Brachybacterium halotolerans subsp. kimchii]|uniref:serine hydrolase n=1 Tax=Brachybacterium halotolerans TaxID=2795215 RepID=UPI001E61A56E|nr:serine hydrolase [Brachybacterium halotolerans]UEJ84255.1 serine hydrolase [Brachybacterium halotolerans subsp. kimchii]
MTIPRRVLLSAAAITPGLLATSAARADPAADAHAGANAHNDAHADADADERRDARREFRGALADLETAHDARIGVSARVVGDSRALTHRGRERFALASTGKVLTSALVLREASEERLQQIIRFTAEDLEEYSPVTAEHVDEGMRLIDLVDAALTRSDNTAQNLLFRELGGPLAVQRRLRHLGDPVTRIDRTEPELNTAIPGDARDTTTPVQMAADLELATLGHGHGHGHGHGLGLGLGLGLGRSALGRDRSAQLLAMMRANTTGDAAIRAGVPSSWTVADKTGAGGYGTSNDIAVITRPHAAPLVLAVYTTGRTEDAELPADLIAQVTRHVVDALD